MLLEFLAVHQAVSLGQDGVDVSDRCFCRSDAQGDADVSYLEVFLEFFQQDLGFLGLLDFFYHEKFVAAHAEDKVFVPDVEEYLSGCAEQLVSGFVSQGIVGFLEFVQIAEDEGEAPPFRQRGQTVFETPAVQEPRQLIRFAQPVQALRHVPIPEQDGKEACQGRKEFFGLVQFFRCRIDGVDEAIRLSIQHQPGQGDALDARDVRGQIRMFLPISGHVGNGKAISLGEVVEYVSQFYPGNRLEILAQGQDAVSFPGVSKSYVIALFFGKYDAVGFQLTADTAHHLTDATDGIRFVHAQADGVVYGCFKEEHLVETSIFGQVFVQIQTGAEVAVFAVPGDEDVPEKKIHASYGIMEDP